MSLKILHFSDAHIGAVNHGKRDAQTDLPLRVMDYLKSLDTIVDAAVAEPVDFVLFSGDAFHHRQPSPTLQREWGRRIMRLSRAGIPTLLLVGNHDLSPALNRAHALDIFQTLDVPCVTVVDRPRFLSPADLNGLPLQVIAIPFISRSGIMAHLNLSAADPAMIYEKLEGNLTDIIQDWLDQSNPDIPVILTAHISIQGAAYGGFRTMVLGNDVELPPALVKDGRLAYVGLGHIHNPQDLNEGNQPPVVYPGSIERVDFGEVKENKYYVIAEIEKRKPTRVEWHKLNTRQFLDRSVTIIKADHLMEQLRLAMPAREDMQDAIVRLVVNYPRDVEMLIDENALRELSDGAFEFHLVRRPVMETRIRIPDDKTVESLSPLELLDLYFKTTHNEEKEVENLMNLARGVIQEVAEDSSETE